MSYLNNNEQHQPQNGSIWEFDDNTITPMVTHIHPTPSDSDVLLSTSHSSTEWESILPLAFSGSHKYTDTQTESSGSSIDERSQVTETPSEEALRSHTPILMSIVYGCINAIIVLPILMSFGSIIYQDDAFASYMPVLVKLTLASGIVHQLCFSALSSLPFAVGQVQDAGLIFLSSMASQMVSYCREHGHDDTVLLATVTVGLSLATALLGLGLVVIGRLRLAQHIKLLPTSVVGGYLAYIGFFCGISGIGLMAGSAKHVTTAVILDRLHLVVPGLLFGLSIYLSVRRLRHMAVLPIGIFLVLAVFYLALWITDTTIDDATKQGWIRTMEPPPAWNHTWDYLRVDKVDWYAFPPLVLTEVSMILVVALSSSLDVAAIELELKCPLDYNGELQMVGLSNTVSGLLGGYTGSYIFSQSIFSLRAGIRSRLAGFVLALCQILVFALPFPILSYIPNFFFGSLLCMICFDLLCEWLWDVRKNLSQSEYIVCLSTFALIQWLGIEYGILAGVCLYSILEKMGLHRDINGNLGISSRNGQASSSEEVPIQQIPRNQTDFYGTI